MQADPTLFDDGKAPGALRTIGEVASALGIRQHVLRYWEEQFPMLRPLKRSGGRRYYRPEDVSLVQQIDRLVHGQGYTLRGARQALQQKGKAPAEPAPQTEVPVSAAGTQLREERTPDALRDRLLALRAQLQAALAET